MQPHVAPCLLIEVDLRGIPESQDSALEVGFQFVNCGFAWAPVWAIAWDLHGMLECVLQCRVESHEPM